MRHLADLAEMVVECLEEDLAFTKICGSCGSNNRVGEIMCPGCWTEMIDYEIAVSYPMWMCPWCDYPYLLHEEKAMQADYCRSCLIRWNVKLETPPEKFRPVEIVIPARQQAVTRRNERPVYRISYSAGTTSTAGDNNVYRMYSSDNGTSANSNW